MFDDQWAKGAAYREPSAADRARQARASRRQGRRRRRAQAIRGLAAWAAGIGAIVGMVAWAAGEDPARVPGHRLATSAFGGGGGGSDRPSRTGGEGDRSSLPVHVSEHAI